MSPAAAGEESTQKKKQSKMSQATEKNNRAQILAIKIKNEHAMIFAISKYKQQTYIL